MSAIRFLHAADLHLDSPFEGLGAQKAALRRSEQRELLSRLAALVAREKLQLVLLSGDLFDSDNSYYETGEELVRCLGQMAVPVFIAPGNHDYYCDSAPYARLALPENVHLFRKNEIEAVSLPALGLRVYGAAFTDKRSRALLRGFRAEQDGLTNLLCLHGELGNPASIYNPIREEELRDSGLAYAALGHIHKASGLRRAGSCWYAWPGCPEGRGFDETGEKAVNLVELDGDTCRLRPVCIASRRYELLRVNVTSTDPLLAIHTQMGEGTARDVYRIVLTGEVERAPDLLQLQRNLGDFFFELQLRDETHLRQNVWDRAGEDSLRGLFLLKLREAMQKARSDEERRRIEQAARWGLAALDNREEVVVHDHP